MSPIVRRTAILDTNALLMPFQFRINLESEIKRLLGEATILVPESVLRELRGLSAKHRKAKGALALAQHFEIIPTQLEGDSAILALARERSSVVVTSDASLLRRLKQLGVPRIFLRARSHLVVEGL